MIAERQFVICIKNDDCLASLELWKVYRVVPDEKAAQDQLIRVIDESGEDYLYDKDYFSSIKLPKVVEELLLKTT
jgi:hypothetical protein